MPPQVLNNSQLEKFSEDIMHFALNLTSAKGYLTVNVRHTKRMYDEILA